MGLSKDFPELFPVTKEVRDRIWKDGVLVFDASFLLEFYTLSPPTQKEVLGVLEGFAKRVWFPYQAIAEFMKNRRPAMTKAHVAYEKQAKELRTTAGEFKALSGSKRHPWAARKDDIETGSKALEAVATELATFATALKDQIENPVKDPVFSVIEKLSDGKTGKPTPMADLVAKTTANVTRLQQMIPPGFEDLGKDPVDATGDLVWWQEAIEKSKEAKLPLLVLSQEKKRDWVWKDNDRVLGPHPMMRRELREAAGQDFIICDIQEFYEFGSEVLKRKAEEDTLRELAEAKKREAEALSRARAAAIYPSLAFLDSPAYLATMRAVEAASRVDPAMLARLNTASAAVAAMANSPVVQLANSPGMKALFDTQRRIGSMLADLDPYRDLRTVLGISGTRKATEQTSDGEGKGDELGPPEKDTRKPE